jgi:hypothetical protein
MLARLDRRPHLPPWERVSQPSLRGELHRRDPPAELEHRSQGPSLPVNAAGAAARPASLARAPCTTPRSARVGRHTTVVLQGTAWWPLIVVCWTTVSTGKEAKSNV